MSHPSDVAAQTSFIGHSEDDKRFRAEKRRKYAKKAVPDPIPDGPCCLRCRNWTPPGEHDEFGHCRLLVTVIGKIKYGPERGVTLGVEDVAKGVEFEWEFMRTRPAFVACSRFAALAAVAEDQEAA